MKRFNTLPVVVTSDLLAFDVFVVISYLLAFDVLCHIYFITWLSPQK